MDKVSIFVFYILFFQLYIWWDKYLRQGNFVDHFHALVLLGVLCFAGPCLYVSPQGSWVLVAPSGPVSWLGLTGVQVCHLGQLSPWSSCSVWYWGWGWAGLGCPAAVPLVHSLPGGAWGLVVSGILELVVFCFPLTAWDLVLGLLVFVGNMLAIISSCSAILGVGSGFLGWGCVTHMVGMLLRLYSSLLLSVLPPALAIFIASVICLLRLLWCFLSTVKVKILATSWLVFRLPWCSGWHSLRCWCMCDSSLAFMRSPKCSVDLL